MFYLKWSRQSQKRVERVNTERLLNQINYFWDAGASFKPGFLLLEPEPEPGIFDGTGYDISITDIRNQSLACSFTCLEMDNIEKKRELELFFEKPWSRRQFFLVPKPFYTGCSLNIVFFLKML